MMNVQCGNFISTNVHNKNKNNKPKSYFIICLEYSLLSDLYDVENVHLIIRFDTKYISNANHRNY